MCKAMEDMRNESLREGMEIGREEGKKELVLQMLSDGRYSIEEIAALSGFSVDEVKLLRESQMS